MILLISKLGSLDAKSANIGLPGLDPHWIVPMTELLEWPYKKKKLMFLFDKHAWPALHDSC